MTSPLQTIDKPFVWFDLDDTIWDMTGNSNIALSRIFESDPDVQSVFAQKGLKYWLDTYHDVNRRLWQQYDDAKISRETLRIERFAEPLQIAGMDRNEAVRAAEHLDGDYLWILGSCPALISGARQAVDAVLAAGLPAGIVSNGFREVQYRKLASGGLSNVFEPIILSDNIGINKPDSRFFDFAVQSAGIAPQNCILVGDNPRSDIKGALDAGWAATVWLVDSRCNYAPEITAELNNDPRCTIIHSMFELPAALGL